MQCGRHECTLYVTYIEGITDHWPYLCTNSSAIVHAGSLTCILTESVVRPPVIQWPITTDQWHIRLNIWFYACVLWRDGIHISRDLGQRQNMGHRGNPEALWFKFNHGKTTAAWLWCIAIHTLTSTVYWCIASKLKAPWNFDWMSNMFLWLEIFLFFVCYHVVPKRHSQLDYELNGL